MCRNCRINVLQNLITLSLCDYFPNRMTKHIVTNNFPIRMDKIIFPTLHTTCTSTINSPNGSDTAYHPKSYSKSPHIRLMVWKEKFDKKSFHPFKGVFRWKYMYIYFNIWNIWHNLRNKKINSIICD